MKATSRERRLQATIEGLEAQVAELKARLDAETASLGAIRAMHKSAEEVVTYWRRKYELLHSDVQGWAHRFKQLSHGVRREFQDFSSSMSELESMARTRE